MKIRQGRAKGLFGNKGAEGRLGNVPKYIKEILKKKKRVKVLEVGTGYGRALLELKQIFGDKVETYGINAESEWNQKLVKKYALHEKLFDKQNINKNLPKIYILDAGKKLPFKNNSVDLVINPATMQYIPDKIHFIEEVNRVLTKEGIAGLELEEERKEHPPEYRNLFEIWHNGERIEIIKYLKKFKNIKIKKSKNRPWHYILMTKARKLDFKLKFVTAIDLEGEFSKNWKIRWWGKKSIYIVK
jgi:ubiquinone/menaquinone biosynthesis C-methylase UbiE